MAHNDAPGLAYKRYLVTDDGVSPLAFPGRDGATVKANTYTHDEYGISAEDPGTTVACRTSGSARRAPWPRSSRRCLW